MERADRPRAEFFHRAVHREPVEEHRHDFGVVQRVRNDRVLSPILGRLARVERLES